MNTLQHYSPLIGRLLIALPFLNFGTYKLTNWDMLVGWLAFKGLPMPEFLLAMSIAIELLGGVFLILGWKVRYASALLFLYLIPVIFIMHNFWAIEGADRQPAVENFGKGLMIMGGLLYVFTFGAGPLSLDKKTSASSN